MNARVLVRRDQIVALHTGADGALTRTLRCASQAPVSERHFARVRKLLSVT